MLYFTIIILYVLQVEWSAEMERDDVWRWEAGQSVGGAWWGGEWAVV
jgi:hypothetical protein